MHGGRPRYGCELMAIGDGTGCRPSFRAPRSKSTPDDFTGSGGIGYGRVRGGSNGLAPARPDTPISHSTVVYYGSGSASSMGQSSNVVPGIAPSSDRSLKSTSWKRQKLPVKCTLLPPTIGAYQAAGNPCMR